MLSVYLLLVQTAKLHVTDRNPSGLFVLDTEEVRLGWTGNTTVGNEGPSVLLSAAVLFQPFIWFLYFLFHREYI